MEILIPENFNNYVPVYCSINDIIDRYKGCVYSSRTEENLTRDIIGFFRNLKGADAYFEVKDYPNKFMNVNDVNIDFDYSYDMNTCELTILPKNDGTLKLFQHFNLKSIKL